MPSFAAIGALFDPPFEVADDLGWKRILGRHFDITVVADGGDEQALVGFAGNHCRSVFPSLQERLARIDPKAGLLLLWSVACHAVGNEDRTHLCLEELRGCLVRRIRWHVVDVCSRGGNERHEDPEADKPSLHLHTSPETSGRVGSEGGLRQGSTHGIIAPRTGNENPCGGDPAVPASRIDVL